MQNDSLLEQLQTLLKHKKSKKYYSEKLGISEIEVEELMKELKKPKEETYFYQVDGEILNPTFVVTTSGEASTFILEEENNHITGDKKIVLESDYPLSPKEIEELVQVDNITSFVDRSWLKSHKNGKWTYSILVVNKQHSPIKFQDEFIKFLSNYEAPIFTKPTKKLSNKKSVSVIIPKQDAHFNKHDINGDNDIHHRFNQIFFKTIDVIDKIEISSDIKEIVYLIGGDQFNSEWTGLTTKGTPQSNILSYQESFELICNHEINTIQYLLESSNKVKIVFVPGNHDEFVGWHLIHFLSSFFRNIENIEFDSSINNTKYHRYNNTAIMFNHGDAVKPKDLAATFPIGFKKEWSLCDNYVILTGDKHHELSMDIHGIRFYQLPQLSNAKSKWDDKNQYVCEKAELQIFVISENNGINEIYKEII